MSDQSNSHGQGVPGNHGAYGGAPVPPPPGSSTPPPPPPPSYTAPTGMYGQVPMPGGGGFYAAPTQEIGSLAKWFQILIGVSVAIDLIVTVAPDNVVLNVIGSLSGLIRLAGGIVAIIWMYRIADNLGKLGRRITFGPLWAIFGWLILPFVWIIPALQMQEVWKASDPSPNWQNSPTNWKIWAWFACGPLTIVSGVIFGASLINSFGDLNDLETEAQLEAQAERVVENSIGPLLLVQVVAVAAAVLYIWFSMELTKRHEQLIASAHR